MPADLGDPHQWGAGEGDFFDQNFLEPLHSTTHEDIGHLIVLERLGGHYPGHPA